MNKSIDRDTASSTRIFDQRSLERDYATLVPLLKPGMRVLDVGCGTGAITQGVAKIVGTQGRVTGIDNTASFINSAKESSQDVPNLEFIAMDLFNFEPAEKFDLVIAARVLQWLSTPAQAVRKMASFLKPGGQLSILDYNHEALEWMPQPPDSMKEFYGAFLRWRAAAGMDNRMAENLARHLEDTGLTNVTVHNADEIYQRDQPDFVSRAGIWSKVAELKQIVAEGFISEDVRVKAIADYDRWLQTDAECMIMKLNEVRGKF